MNELPNDINTLRALVLEQNGVVLQQQEAITALKLEFSDQAAEKGLSMNQPPEQLTLGTETVPSVSGNKPRLLTCQEQRKALLLIQIGNFLEHFDLMLYVHSAVILNVIFFPKTDPRTDFLLTTISFSSMYLLKPLGSLFWGFLGDRYGRKIVVMFTTALMSCCAFIIATLPSYDRIGIAASVILISCRLLQGFSASGEVSGAKVYLCEIAAPPKNYFYTSLVTVSSALGGFFSLLITNYFNLLYPEKGWRYLFFFGSAIAMIGVFARTYLKETPEFLIKRFKSIADNKNKRLEPLFSLKKFTNRYVIGYLAADCLGPLGFYVFYIYCGNILKNTHYFTPSRILNHNLLLAGAFLLSTVIFARLTLRYNPIKIAKIRCLLLITALPFLPLFLQGATSQQLFLIQMVYGILCEGCFPAHAIFIKAFSTLQRLTTVSFVFGLSRIIVCLITTYGCWWFNQLFGETGIMLLILGSALMAFWGLRQFSIVDSTGVQAATHEP